MRLFAVRLPSFVPIGLLVIAALLVGVQQTAVADLIVPADIETFHRGDTDSPGNGSNSRTIDGSGMSKADPADPSTWTVSSNAWQDDWQGFSGDNSGNNTWVVLDLGAPTANLDTMYLWNVQEGVNGANTGQWARGMNGFDIYHSTAPTVAPPATSGSVTAYDFGSGGWTLLSSETLGSATGLGDPGETYDVSGASGAQYIGFHITSNHGGNRTGFGEVAFTTAIPTGAPAVATLPATDVLSGSARIRGDLTDLGTSTPTVKLYWGTVDGGASAGGWTTVEDLGTRTSTGEFFSDISGLTPNTTYHFRAFGTNAQGDDWASTSESFTTLAAAPAVDNLAASDVAAFSATLGAEVTSTGGEDPTVTIYYGSSDGGTTQENWGPSVSLGAQSGQATASATGLSAGTMYYYRAFASNSGGGAWASNSETFTTTALSLPAVSNSAATGITGITAVLNGAVTNTGGDLPNITIYYGTIDEGTAKGSWGASVALGPRSGSFSQSVIGLTPESTYYFRALASNAAGEAWATPSLSFATPAYTPPSVVINEIHYDEDTKTVRAEFIELHNPSGDAVDLSGCYFSDGIDFVFPGGTTLASGGYLVVAEDPPTIASRYGHSGALGPFANGTKLKNSGELITLRDPGGTKIDEVDYGLGFPWPTVGDDIGTLLVSPSIELINPLLDNDLGGSWRASGFPVATAVGGGGGSPVNYIASNAAWKYLDDGSDQGTAWRASAFDDTSWLSGGAELGYGDGDEATVVQSGPTGSRYATTYFRHSTNIPAPSTFASFTISITYDDAYAIYVNGNEVARHSGLTANAAYDVYSSNSVGDNANDTLNIPTGAFSPGENVIAVEIHQSSGGSSDISFALSLTGEVSGGTPSGSFAPTPGAINRSFSSAIPPQIRQVDHNPVGRVLGQDKTILTGEDVLVTAKITDPDGVGPVTLAYQLVDPGDYFCRYNKFNSNGSANENSRYEDPAEWTTVTMSDDGSGGDALSADSIYSVTLPGSLQTNRRLVRYRISAEDTSGTAISVPYSDDPQPNFAYFVYDGTPDWSGVIRPGDTAANYPGSLMSSIPTYFLLSTNTWVDDSQFGGYGGSEYLWPGTLVYDGKVYDHVQYRPRGGGHRFQYGKNFWKFDFGRGRRFQARDRYGKKYDAKWSKLNFSSIVQQVGFNHRGEQGLFEGVGFRLFELCGVEACETHYVQYYVVDNASPTGSDQYEGDYYGLFLAIEQMDGQYLDQHGLPDGNLYKIEGYSGQSNNQGPTQVDNRSDVSDFISAYRNGTPNAQWWEDNLDIDRYLSYRTVVEGIHHYDIAYGKNYFYYHNPETDKFQVHPWDLDLTWANNMYGNGNHDFKSKVANNAAFNRRYQNRVREIMDLIYNDDEGHRLIDEMVRDVWTPGSPSLVSADRRLWDNNPRLNHPDRYYDVAGDKDFSGMIQVLKNYIVSRGSWMTTSLLTDRANIPDMPTISYDGPVGNPTTNLVFTSSAYNSPGSVGFGAMEWRLAEVYNPSTPNYVAGEPYIYEIENPTESGELTGSNSSYQFLPISVRVGQTYRARVRHMDADGRWSHWSDAVEFTAGAPDVTVWQQNLMITEIMYHPSDATAGEQSAGHSTSDFEYIELKNISPTLTLDLSDLRFTKGVDFDFIDGSITTLAPGEYVLVVRKQSAFESRHGTGLPIAGEWELGDNLSNGGENLKLSFGAGEAVHEFTYGDDPPWPTSPDGDGPSLVLIEPDSAPPLADPSSWRPSTAVGGTPGGSDAVDFSGDPDADGDGDRLSAFMEHALGTSDGDPSRDGTPVVGVGLFNDGTGTFKNYPTITFQRNLAADDVVYEVQTSTTLEPLSWVSGAAAVEYVSMVDKGDGTALVTWRSMMPAAGLEREFIRLVVRSR